MTGRMDLVVAFGLAAGVHVAGLGYFSATVGFEGAGAEGRAALNLAVAPAGLSALVADWEAVPEVAAGTEVLGAPEVEAAFTKVDTWSDTNVAMQTSKLSEAPELAAPPLIERSVSPALAAMQLPAQGVPAMDRDDGVVRLAAPVMPVVSLPSQGFDAVMSVERAVIAAPRPVKRPQRRSPAPALVARGTGGGVSAGNLDATQDAETIAPAARKAAQASWARTIQGRIAQHQTYPRGVRGRGRVRLQMDILADGRLGAVRIDRSSGIAAFDTAALSAAQAAAPFPPAPKLYG